MLAARGVPGRICEGNKLFTGCKETAWPGLELLLLIPGAAGMLKLLQMLGEIPQKHLLELPGVAWRQLGRVGQRIQGWRHCGSL